MAEETPAPTDTPPGGALRDPTFVGVLATGFVVALGFGLIVPALPTFARLLGASYTATSAVVAVFAGVRLLSSTPAGAVVDRVGSRMVVVVGILIVAVSSGAIALADSATQLIALRGFGGVGSAMFITGIGQHIVVTVPARQRGRAFGLLQGSFLLGGASGPAVGGLLVEVMGIRAPFVVYAASLIIAAVVAGRTIVDASSDTSSPTAEVATPGAPGPMGRLLRDRTFLAALFLAMVVQWATQGLRFFGIPVFADEGLGMSAGGLGIVLTLGSVAQGAVLWPASSWSDARGRLWPARTGAVVFTIAVAGLVWVTGPVELGAWVMLQGAAIGMVSAVPSAVVGDLAPPQAAGRAIGLHGVARDIGAVVGVQLSGVVADQVGFDAVFGITAGLLACGVVAAFLMRETLESDAELDE